MLISDLTIESKDIGSGHFGMVHKGSDPILGTVAVKIFRRGPFESAFDWSERKQNLLEEGVHLQEASHPNVVRVHQILESDADESIYLVMEYCGGGTLQDKFEGGPVSISDLRGYLTDAALGLRAVHSREMVHRDIKPSNILLTENGRAKLADFGLVSDDLVYGYASAMGYSDHLAPEVHHDGLTSIRSDMWAFGMTAYRLLHGKDFYDLLPLPRYEVSGGGFAKRLPWLPHVPQEWRRFVRKAMHDDPNLRIQDADELLSMLGKLPTHPDWSCKFAPNQTTWKLDRGNRSIHVNHTTVSVRRHEWDAVSLPKTGFQGRRRSVAGSDGIVGKIRVFRELEAFLAGRSW